MNEWMKLKSRYQSNKQYERRKVILKQIDFEDFKNYIIDLGAEIALEPCQSESLRFYLNNEIGIVYSKGSGNLLAHNLGIDYQKSIGDPIEKNNYSVIPWSLK